MYPIFGKGEETACKRMLYIEIFCLIKCSFLESLFKLNIKQYWVFKSINMQNIKKFSETKWTWELFYGY